MQDETLDLVDEKDEVIGTILRSDYARLVTEKLGFIRAVEMLIENDKGELWIPKRTANKRIAPNGLDYSMGGHVASGESYLEAALREIEEELNLSLRPEDLIFKTKFSPSLLPYFRVLYIYRSNETPIYNPEDYVSAQWTPPANLLSMIENGVTAKDSMQETISYLLRNPED